jgi:hypothetical protein
LVKLPDFCTTRAADCGQHRCTQSHDSARYFAALWRKPMSGAAFPEMFAIAALALGRIHVREFCRNRSTHTLAKAPRKFWRARVSQIKIILWEKFWHAKSTVAAEPQWRTAAMRRRAILR